MSYQVRYTRAAKEDITRLYEFLLEEDIEAAHKALSAIQKGILFLQSFPFSCRKATEESPLLRKMLIPFGKRGYVLLFEIENEQMVTILAVRHQREEDYY